MKLYLFPLTFQEGFTSEAYQRPDKSFFQEPKELNNLVNTSNLIQMFLPKQADIDKVLKVIQRHRSIFVTK